MHRDGRCLRSTPRGAGAFDAWVRSGTPEEDAQFVLPAAVSEQLQQQLQVKTSLLRTRMTTWWYSYRVEIDLISYQDCHMVSLSS